MRTTYRHIGYYNRYKDIDKLFGETADNVVKRMHEGFGVFFNVIGNPETDIHDINDEEDANLFRKTTDKNYLVRFQHGAPDGEGWYIDVYKRIIIDDDKNDVEQKIINLLRTHFNLYHSDCIFNMIFNDDVDIITFHNEVVKIMAAEKNDIDEYDSPEITL